MRERERERESLKYNLKNLLKNLFYNIFLTLNKLKTFKLITKKIFNLHLIEEGYCVDWTFLINKSKNKLFLGENIFIRKFDKLKIVNCLDIGANIGEFSTQILLNKNTKVIAFEPLPGCCEQLAIIEKNNNSRFKHYQNALSNIEKIDCLFFGESTSGLASLETAINDIPYVKESNKNKIRVVIKKLDNFLDNNNFLNIDFIKIDVEGHEMSVIEGGFEFFKKNNIKLIQVEFNWHNLMTNQSIYKYSKIFNNYVTTRLNLIDGKLKIVDPKDFMSNIYHLSNYIFVQKEFLNKNKELLIN
jgi:FkbM family methyltransferase